MLAVVFYGGITLFVTAATGGLSVDSLLEIQKLVLDDDAREASIHTINPLGLGALVALRPAIGWVQWQLERELRLRELEEPDMPPPDGYPSDTRSRIYGYLLGTIVLAISVAFTALFSG